MKPEHQKELWKIYKEEREGDWVGLYERVALRFARKMCEKAFKDGRTGETILEHVNEGINNSESECQEWLKENL